ncbi:MAG: Gfo/Idh/MocA family oxidoreductase [Elusimicrobia bacterium]|nr:Gfo/Idh/MocA family oxidoreductase [Elusimicrobiota bacterium]
MLKGAIIGFGQVAEKAHALAWKEKSGIFSILAVAEQNEERLKRAASVFPEARLYPDSLSLLRSESSLDFVDIATPPASHPVIILQALQQNCHVLCEKPLLINPKDLETIRALALAKNKAVFTVHNWKKAPHFLKASDILKDKVLGGLRHVELHTLRNQPAISAAADSSWRKDPAQAGGGILVDHGWHLFSLLQELIPQNPLSITARLRMGEGGVEEEASCFVVYPKTTALLYLTWRSPERSNWGVLHGTQGTLEIRDDRLVLQRKGKPIEIFPQEERLSASSAHPTWFSLLLEDFRAEISNPKLRGKNLQEAEICAQLLFHAYQSHRMGCKTVSLPLLVPPLGISPKERLSLSQN